MTAVVLAAGGGRRMGRPKLLIPYRGQPLLKWTVELVQCLPVSHRLLVLGPKTPEVKERIRLPGWQVEVNRGWEEGMASSLRLAEASAGPGGLLVFLGDMPHVPKKACLEVLSQAGDTPVAPACNGVRGFPVYLPPSFRPKLRLLRGDRGARGLLSECRLLQQDNPGVLWDVDEMKDLACGPLKG